MPWTASSTSSAPARDRCSYSGCRSSSDANTRGALPPTLTKSLARSPWVRTNADWMRVNEFEDLRGAFLCGGSSQHLVEFAGEEPINQFDDTGPSSALGHEMRHVLDRGERVGDGDGNAAGTEKCLIVFGVAHADGERARD